MMSTNKPPNGWLLLLYSLPTQKTAGRVNLWRKLKKIGAHPLKTSTYVLPDEPAHLERFQWLAQQVRDGGGEATLAHVTQIEGLSNDDLANLFNEARAEDYATLAQAIHELIAANRKRLDAGFADALGKLQRRFQEVRAIDYFECAAAHDAEMLLQQAGDLTEPRGKTPPKLEPKRFQRRKWLTRPRPEIDRVGSAWLIRKFIDPDATFIFSPRPDGHPDAVPYDMMDVEFTHHGDDCTFETLLKRFAIDDPTARRMGKMIHDADLEDGKFQRVECVGIDILVKGWARLGLTDAEILEKGLACFDALYAALQRNAKNSD